MLNLAFASIKYQIRGSLVKDLKPHINFKSLLLSIALLAMTACEKHGLEISLKEGVMMKLSAQVDEMIADKSCDGTSDCASIAWGIDPCGYTRSYLVYNPSKVDVPALEELVTTYNQLDRELNHLTGAVILTDCYVFLRNPEVICVEQVCQSTGDRYGVI